MTKDEFLQFLRAPDVCKENAAKRDVDYYVHYREFAPYLYTVFSAHIAALRPVTKA